MEFVNDMLTILLATLRDVAPIVGIIVFFQLVIIRRPFKRLHDLIIGIIYVILGMSFFLLGLEKALFPLGSIMAEQLTSPSFINPSITINNSIIWQDYIWVYIFGACIGFATTLAEPALIAVAIKAEQISGGSIKAWYLRLAVSLGVAVGISLGTYRIVSGIELYYFIIAGYILVIIQTLFSPKMIIGLAYDSGGVTTSTVTVPLVTALGIGLASTIPGRNPLLDGFGLIAFASLFPIMAVLAYAQFADWIARRAPHK
ncbi:MAG: hypothetical protein COB26_08250 [Piscirickettsiaceae bacterium]|nr:MAG: hypothetical protein COB89_04820 [Piscirickettsiaceae bacterium]PCI68446.1 MAG: hypothetical protein COB26_08250 [Piscirickettsiaceae bacterium]